MSHNERLIAVFEAAKAALPRIDQSSTIPLGMGKNGLVVLCRGVIYKIIFRFSNEARHKETLKTLEREVKVLRLFTDNPPEEVDTPRLIAEPEMIDHDQFMAYFQMSCLPGKFLSMLPPTREDEPAYMKGYERTGTLLAKFHRAVRHYDIGDVMRIGPLHSPDIITVAFLDDKTNKLLELADAYIQEKGASASANVHGDIHLGNVSMSDWDQPVGFADFSHMGFSKNKMIEIRVIPEPFLPAFLHGFQREIYDEDIGPMVSAAKLSIATNRLRHGALKDDEIRLITHSIQEELKILGPLIH